MNKITHDIVDIIKDKLIENNYEPFEISLYDLLDEFNFNKRIDLRNDLVCEINANLRLNLMSLEYDKDTRLFKITSIIKNIAFELKDYLCAITLEQLDSKVITIIQKYTRRKTSEIGSMMDNFEKVYKDRYFVYNLDKEFKIVIFWKEMYENKDLKKSIIYPYISSYRGDLEI